MVYQGVDLAYLQTNTEVTRAMAVVVAAFGFGAVMFGAGVPLMAKFKEISLEAA